MPSDFNTLLEKARQYCLRGEKSVYDVQQKLYKWYVPEQWHDSILKSLEEDKFIDESRFASSFARDKCYLNKWGRIKIRYHLRQKNIPEDLINKGLNDIEEEKYLQIFCDVAGQKLKSLETKTTDAYTLKQKLLRFLSQRGFEISLLDDTDILKDSLE